MAQSQVNDPPTPIGIFRSDLPTWVEPIITRSLAKSPADRFQSAVEFHESFARCLAGQPMAPPYASSAPTELLMTPSRAMPTESMQRSVGAAPPSTGAVQSPTGQVVQSSTGSEPVPEASQEFAPTVLSPTPLGVRSPTAQAPLPPPAETMMAPSGAVPMSAAPSGAIAALSGALPVAAPLPPVDVIAPLSGAVAPAAGKTTASVGKKGGSGMIAAAAAVLVIVGGAGYWFLARRPALLPPPVESTPGQTPTDIVAPADVAPPPVAADVPAVPDASVAAGPKGAAGAARATGPLTPAGAPVARPGGPTVATAASSAPGPAPVAETPETFTDVKLMVVKGRKADDQDVSARFADGQITLVPKKGGEALASMRYSAAVRATYSRSRDPKWDAATFSPPQNLDVGGMLRTSKHWLVLQAQDAYLILRLDDSNFRRILETFTTRTSLAVDRPVSTDKP
jgi:hypothetical protein